MDDVALGMKSASGAMHACIISAACESRYFKSLHGDLLFYTVHIYVCMYAFIHSIAYYLYVIVCIHVCMYVCRDTVEAVSASAPAATSTTFCSANISRSLIHSYWDKSISIALGESGGRPCQSFLHINILIRKL